MNKIYQSKGIYRILKKSPRFIKNPLIYGLCKFRKNELSKLKTPKVITFFITNVCNARCSHCFYWKELNTAKKQEMRLDQIEKIVKSLKNRLLSVVLTGGEPFLREDLTKICELFSTYKKVSKIIIPTNGYSTELISIKVREILKKTNAKLDIIISMDGLHKTAAKIRGLPDIFEKCENTIDSLKKIKDNRLSISLMTTISKQNFKEIPDLMEFNKKHWNIPQRFQYVRSCNEVYNLDPRVLEGFVQRDKESSLPDLKILEELNFTIENNCNEKSISMDLNNLERETALEILKSKGKVLNCVAGVYDAVIYPGGNVSFCEFTKPFGNLKETDYNFYKLWTSEKANLMRQKIQSCSCIHSCNLLDSLTHDNKKLKKLFA